MKPLRAYVEINPLVDTSGLSSDSLVSFVPMDAVDDGATGGVRLQSRALAEVQKGYTPFAEGDVLWAKITPCMQNGKSCIARRLQNGIGFGSTEFHVFRVRDSEVSVEFVWEFLSQETLRRVATFAFTGSAGHQRVSHMFLAELPFPKLSREKQSELVGHMSAARESRRKKLQEADDLLASLDNFVLDALGIALPNVNCYRTTYAVRAKDVRLAQTIYPDYFHPERMTTIRSVQSRYAGDPATKLSDIADFIRDQKIVDPNDDYLGLANVQSNTGERIASTEEDGKGNCFNYRKGDVLFARLRPYLNKIYRAESGGVCSTEFHVIRIRADEKGRPRLIPDYLAAVLRSSIVLAQTKHMMTGNTHPRLANDDVVNLVVPVPDRTIQENIADEVARRRDTARRLRDEAARIWDEAKHQFEEELLGPESREQAQ
ncbi:MAG: hypothetical protein U1F68_18785 [Gammaproteobacteria bacterium]